MQFHQNIVYAQRHSSLLQAALKSPWKRSFLDIISWRKGKTNTYLFISLCTLCTYYLTHNSYSKLNMESSKMTIQTWGCVHSGLKWIIKSLNKFTLNAGINEIRLRMGSSKVNKKWLIQSSLFWLSISILFPSSAFCGRWHPLRGGKNKARNSKMAAPV